MRLINADAINFHYEILLDKEDGHRWNILAVGKDEIDDMPTIEPKTGHWIHHEEKMFVSAEHWECSWCHRTTMIYPFRVSGNDYDAMYYCPKCGAKMVESGDKE